MIRYIAESEDDDLTLNEPRPKAYLVLLTNGRVSHSFPLGNEMVEVGRDKGNSVVVADQKVSRHHVSLNPIDETFILIDRGSANGTYLNGVLISQPIRLKDQDRITVGDTTFLFSIEMPTSDVIDQPDPIPSSFSPQLPPSSPAFQMAGTDNKPVWLLIGCLGLIIVALLMVLAVILGLYLGRSQVAGVLMLAGMF